MSSAVISVEPLDCKCSADSPLDSILEYCEAAEPGYEMLFDALFGQLEPVSGVESYTEVIKGEDDNDITLYIHKPTGVAGPLPCVVHTHGGGMVILKASGAGYQRWRDLLAATGMVVVGVEFRNGAGELGPHPFPAGLNDCASSVRWVTENRESLGVSTVIMSGESGGGNLSIATTLKASKEGWLEQIAGVYAMCPYISNAYASKDPHLASLFENDDYFLNVANMGALAKAYDPDGANAENALCWPYHAKTSFAVSVT